MNKKGQGSAEFLVLLSVTVFLITAAIIVSNEQIGGVGMVKERNDALNSIDDLSAAAKEVYAQGEGAKKQVYIYLPSSYEPENSSVGGKSIRMKVRGSDYVAVEDFDVRGNLPGMSGAHWVWVVSEGNRVRIGSVMISLSRNSIYLIMSPASVEDVSLTVENIWGSPIDVSHAEVWSASDVLMDVSPSGSFHLNEDESQAVYVTFTANADAVGYYNGEIRFTAEDGLGNNETVRVPVTVEVVGNELTLAPKLTVTPDFWGETFYGNGTREQTFMVCTNNFTAVTGVTFTPSGGAPGSWVSNTSSLGPIAEGSCELKTMALTVPNGTLTGTYVGSIGVVGAGVADAQDTITLFINVEAEDSCTTNQTGWCNCPVGANYWDVPLCDCMPATIYVDTSGIIVGGPDNGQPYNGTLRGGPGTDVIVGTNGSDMIRTSTGGDKVCGMEGDDTIYGANTEDIIDGGMGDDIIYGEAGGDLIFGKDGNDIIYGGQGDDEIDCGSGNDQVYGGDGKDLVYGGPGNDELYGDDGIDWICGNSGTDTIDGGRQNDDLDGGTGPDILNGGDGSDACYRAFNATECESTPGGYYTICGPS